MEELLQQPLIFSAVSDYPRAQWKRVATALLVHGINSLKRQCDLSKLSVGQLEAICGVKKNIPNISLFIKELSGIKKELLKLDKKIDLTANKENVDKNLPTQHLNKRSTSQPTKAKGEKGTRGDAKAQLNHYKTQEKQLPSLARASNWPKSTRACTAVHAKDYERVRTRNMVPSIREARRLANKLANRTAYLHPKKSAKAVVILNPAYLRNIQSRIISNIERDKMEYNLRKNTMKKLGSSASQANARSRNPERAEKPATDKYLENPIVSHFAKMADYDRSCKESYNSLCREDESSQKDIDELIEHQEIDAAIRGSSQLTDEQFSASSSYEKDPQRGNWKAKARPIYKETSEYRVGDNRKYFFSIPLATSKAAAFPKTPCNRKKVSKTTNVSLLLLLASSPVRDHYADPRYRDKESELSESSSNADSEYREATRNGKEFTLNASRDNLGGV
eukprot:TRINITY_DN12139_c0_g2_i8.p1 TRINITY_DN12139_c0_g2~~TRINITY_DN12139_c0_g2_i8.p1  ORF type:complete len:450 (+),score=100.68 TRINITY_DN12139_c0_g2_i8:1051-2400(+)